MPPSESAFVVELTMATSKDVLVGDVVGFLKINRIERPMFIGTCTNCKEQRVVPDGHINMILKGRGYGCNCSRRKKTLDPEYKWRFSSYKQAARKRNIEWGLTYEEFLSLVVKPCHYCATDPEMRPSHGKRWDFKFPMSGIDRRNNDVGYLSENVVPCCTHCNRAKWDYSEQDFLDWLKKAYLCQFKGVA